MTRDQIKERGGEKCVQNFGWKVRREETTLKMYGLLDDNTDLNFKENLFGVVLECEAA
jgi:hypothetical protein